MLAEVKDAGPGIMTDTKLLLTAPNPLVTQHLKYWHTPEDVRRGLMDSLGGLRTKTLHLFFMHAPYRQHPLEDTMREVGGLYK